MWAGMYDKIRVKGELFMWIPEIPNNSLTEEITEIVQLSQRLENDYDFIYDPPATEAEITLWEIEHQIKIPESIKEWLRFSGYSNICNELSVIKGVKSYEVDCELVPDDLVIIGEVIGTGEFLCFSKRTGEIVRYDFEETRRYKDFKDFLNETLIRSLRKI